MAVELSDLNAIIEERLADFDKPGVLSVRPGFKVKDDWLTGARSIVVTVRRKVAHPPEAERLPSQVAGVPVDVRQSSPEKRMELDDPAAYASQLRLTPDTGSVPHFPDERTLAGIRPAATASAHAQLSAIAKPKLGYTGPDGVSLQPIEADATILLSASPDTGWPVLSDFLVATTESLTVGLYDFTAAHIAAAVKARLAGRQLKLVLDHPPLNPTADQSDPATVAELRQALGGGFSQAWALTRLDKEATAWIFPTAYHIKVAVRDRSAFWLSSGNWNKSNQPDIDPFTKPADAQAARHSDRDWHVVIQQPQLAGVFEDYILHDLAVAAANNNPPEQPGPPLTPPPLTPPPLTPPPLGSTQTPPFSQFFPAASITGTTKIAPLLTPDPGVYAGAVRSFIATATRTLYMQFQYIEPPRVGSTNVQGFIDLINAVIDRQESGVEVRIIMGKFEKAGYLEQLQGMGLDAVNNVKIQNNVHNKGIIVDGTAVLVSSQNWSADGTLYNRDAGVIIYNETAAQYFQQIFLHDWEHLAIQKVQPD